MPQVKARDVMTEVQGILQSIATLTNRIVLVYDTADLAKQLASIGTYPGCGVIYEGMKAAPSSGPSGHVGVSAHLVFSIILVMQPETIFNKDTKLNTIDTLDSIRSSMIGKTSVTGHKWQFLVEAPADLNKGLVFWVQRWAVPIQLPPQ